MEAKKRNQGQCQWWPGVGEGREMQRGDNACWSWDPGTGDELIACGDEEERGSRQSPRVLV